MIPVATKVQARIAAEGEIPELVRLGNLTGDPPWDGRAVPKRSGIAPYSPHWSQGAR